MTTPDARRSTDRRQATPINRDPAAVVSRDSAAVLNRDQAAVLSRRTVLAGAAGTAGLAMATVGLRGDSRPSREVVFTLDAEVLDGGEQITSVTLNTARFAPIDPASLTTGTFGVHATATVPTAVANDGRVYGECDLDRQVTAARLNRRGDIVLDLDSGDGKLGGGTLGYLVNRDRNVGLDLVHRISQHAPIGRRGAGSLTIPRFVQGALRSPEVDAFTHHVARSGMRYRLFSPPGAGSGGAATGGGTRTTGGTGTGGDAGHALIVWLHGAGEGAVFADGAGASDGHSASGSAGGGNGAGAGFRDNETTLRANRGPLGFATDVAQQMFGGAYVVAPQCPSYWMEDGSRFAPLIREIIDDLLRRCPIDRSRVSVVGCSNGGYMALKMTTAYPGLFAASVPICGVVRSLQSSSRALITDAELAQITTPTWLVATRADTTVSPQANTVHAGELIPGSRVSLYDRVTWNGHRFDDHFAWIYVARDDPAIDGTRIWQWMAKQHSRG